MYSAQTRVHTLEQNTSMMFSFSHQYAMSLKIKVQFEKSDQSLTLKDEKSEDI